MKMFFSANWRSYQKGRILAEKVAMIGYINVNFENSFLILKYYISLLVSEPKEVS